MGWHTRNRAVRRIAHMLFLRSTISTSGRSGMVTVCVDVDVRSKVATSVEMRCSTPSMLTAGNRCGNYGNLADARSSLPELREAFVANLPERYRGRKMKSIAKSLHNLTEKSREWGFIRCFYRVTGRWVILNQYFPAWHCSALPV